MVVQLDQSPIGAVQKPRILVTILTYLGIMAPGNLLWEVAQLPLYTIWTEGTNAEIFFAVIHCTLGDILIAAVSLIVSWVAIARRTWPSEKYWLVATVALLVGAIYTVFSEWLNVSLRASWSYRDAMPTVGPLNTGLAPLLQWIVLPSIDFVWLRRAVLR